MKSATTFVSLPQELHLQIRSYLTTQDHAQIAVTCKLCYQVYFPALSSLYILPNSLHLRIRSYLNEENRILVGLACKRVQSLYFPTSSEPVEAPTLWEMAAYRAQGSQACQVPGNENPVLDRWLSRIKLARFLKDWIKRVTFDARRRARMPSAFWKASMEFCVGCVRFKHKSYRWKSGEECLSRIERMTRWEHYEAECSE